MSVFEFYLILDSFVSVMSSMVIGMMSDIFIFTKMLLLLANKDFSTILTMVMVNTDMCHWWILPMLELGVMKATCN